MKTAVYLCSKAIAEQFNISGKDSVSGHEIAKKEQENFLWSKDFSNQNISPDTFLALKNFFKMDKIILIDRVKSSGEIMRISDHNNRSGENFLRGKTPHEDRPTFPDASNIYNEKRGRKVVTVGPKRFERENRKNLAVVSEAIAPIAVLWHYVGVKPLGIGCPGNILLLSQLMKRIMSLR